MRKKQIMERASTLKQASVRTGRPFVLAAATPELKHVQLAGYECKACGSEFASQQGTEPFCINCGSEKVEIQAKAATAALPESDKALSAVECKSCGTHNVLADVTAGVLDGHMHCVTCGTSLTFETEGLDRPIDGADADDVLDNTTEQANSGPDDLAGGMTDDTPISKPVSGPDDLAGGPTDDAPITDADPGSVTDALPTQQAKTEQAMDIQDAPLIEQLGDDELLEQQSDPAQDEQFMQELQDQQIQSVVKASLVALVLSANATPEFELASTDTQIIAFADNVPVARLRKDKAGEHADVFHTASFQKSILAIAKRDGVKAALAAYPFEALTIDFPQASAIRAMVERKAVEASTAYQEQAASYSEEFMQCVSLASTALTKGTFRKHENALKRGFIDTLTTAGVQGAARIVDTVFASQADSYHRTLLTLASELMKKPADVRNELAETLGDMNMIASEEMPNPENEEVVIETADRLSTRMESASVRPSKTKAVTTATETASSRVSISELRQHAGGRLF